MTHKFIGLDSYCPQILRQVVRSHLLLCGAIVGLEILPTKVFYTPLNNYLGTVMF